MVVPAVATFDETDVVDGADIPDNIDLSMVTAGATVAFFSFDVPDIRTGDNTKKRNPI